MEKRRLIASCIVGYGCFLALDILAFWNVVSFSAASPPGWQGNPLPAMTLGLVIGFALILLLHESLPGHDRSICFAGTVVLLSAGLLLSDQCSNLHSNGLVDLRVIGALCMGVGSACGLCCWLLVFSHLEFKTVWISLVAGSILSVLPVVLIGYLSLSESPLLSAMLIEFLLIASLLLQISLNSMETYYEKTATSNRPSTCHTGDGSNRLGFFHDISLATEGLGLVLPCIVVLAFFQPLLDGSGLNAGLTPLSKILISGLCNILGATVVFALGFMFSWRAHIQRILLSITPAFAAICALFPFISERYWIVYSFLSMLIFAILSLSVILFAIQLSKARRLPAPYVFSILALCLYAPSFLGTLLGGLIPDTLITPKYLTSGVLMFAMVAYIVLTARIRLRADNTIDADWPEVQHEVVSEEFGMSAPADDEKALRAVSETFGLTAREEEILALMCRGRNVPAIADTLLLSTHTVRGYVKNLYQKCDVHSRQELLNLVDSFL